MDYEISEVRLTWERRGVRHRLVYTRGGERVVERAEDGRYVRG